MIYLIYGEEQYLVRDFISRIIEKNKGAAIEKLDSPSLNSLVELLSIPSLFSPDRIIIAEDLDLTEDSEQFASALKNMAPNLTLIIKSSDGFDKRTKFYKAVEPLCEVHEFKSIPEWEVGKLADFVISAFSKLNKKISRDNADMLVESVGRNMALLNSEIEKIATYAGDKNTISESDIEEISIRSSLDAFSLTKYIFQKDKARSLKALETLILDNEDPIALLGLISSQYRMLFKIKLLSSQNASKMQIAGKLRQSPYYVEKLMSVAPDFKIEKLQDAMQLLYDTDLKLKSGYNHKTELSLLVSDLLS